MLGDHTYTGLLQASNSEKKKELDLGDKFITLTSIKVTAPKKKNLQPSVESKSSLSYCNTSQLNANTIFNIKRKHIINIISQENK